MVRGAVRCIDPHYGGLLRVIFCSRGLEASRRARGIGRALRLIEQGLTDSSSKDFEAYIMLGISAATAGAFVAC